MVIGTSTESSAPSMASWLAILQQNSKSEAQLQAEMLEGVTETIKEVQEEAAEKAKDAAKNAEGSEVTKVEKSDGIKDPSEVTKQDIQSPVDIKL